MYIYIILYIHIHIYVDGDFDKWGYPQWMVYKSWKLHQWIIFYVAIVQETSIRFMFFITPVYGHPSYNP